MKERRHRFIEDETGATTGKRRFRIHVVCVMFGALMAIVVSYVPVTSHLTSHIALGVPAVPSAVQELADRMLGL